MPTVHEPENVCGHQNEHDELQFTFCTHHGETNQVNTSTMHRNIPSTWILLNNQSTIDVFIKAKLLKNIRAAKTWMTIHCTAGTVQTNLVGDLPGYGTVWYHPTGIANKLSLAKICAAGYHVTYNSNNGNEFVVRKSSRTICTFKQFPKGLFYLDTRAVHKDESLFVTTVANNQYKYTSRDYSCAELAKKFKTLSAGLVLSSS
jgi:hypothetical protein